MTTTSPATPKHNQPARDVVEFRGHPMVLSRHPTTIEVTTEEHLTEKGDCIIGVGANKGCAQLDERLKEALRRDGSRVEVTLSVGAMTFAMKARGDSRLQLTDPHDIVIRKSDFISVRTLALGSTAAARDIPNSVVEKLKDPETRGYLEIEVI
jgi:uncharacterized protein